MLQRGPLLLVGLVAFALVLGVIERLSLAHADTTALISFLTTVTIPSIPAVASWWNGRKTKKHAEQASASAIAAEANTNGKMDMRFAQIRTMVQSVADQMDHHLTYHADKEGDKP